MFVLCKNGKESTDANRLCKTAEGRLCVWLSEIAATKYAESHSFDNWRVRPAVSNDYSIVGKMKRNRMDKSRPCYKIIDEDKSVNKKAISSGSLVELFENYELRKFAISSRADSEKEFISEVSQVLSSTQTHDWNTRLKELIPLVVDMCCKYRGYKAESVFERRELVAGDLEMPKALSNVGVAKNEH